MKSPAGLAVVTLAIALSTASCSMEAAIQERPSPPPPPPPVVTASAAVADPEFALAGAAEQGGLMFGRVPAGARSLTLDGNPIPFSRDGRFLIGFGRDASPAALLVATLGNGRGVSRRLSIARRAWPIEKVAGIPRFALPSAEFSRRRPAELAAINAARASDHESDGWRQQFIWPAAGRVSGVFGSERVYANGEKGAPHSGVDIARPAGAPVVAPADGVVVLAADHPFTLEGNLLMIDHGMGLNSAFLHLSRIDVKAGDHVRRGQAIGAVGMTGRATGPHLHWAVKWQDQRIDPQALIAASAMD